MVMVVNEDISPEFVDSLVKAGKILDEQDVPRDDRILWPFNTSEERLRAGRKEKKNRVLKHPRAHIRPRKDWRP
jgi:hypothetical protein